MESGALIFSSVLWAKKNFTPSPSSPRQTQNFEKTPLIKVLGKFLYLAKMKPSKGLGKTKQRKGGKNNGVAEKAEVSFGLSFISQDIGLAKKSFNRK